MPTMVLRQNTFCCLSCRGGLRFVAIGSFVASQAMSCLLNGSIPMELEGGGTGVGRVPTDLGTKPDRAVCFNAHGFAGQLGSGNQTYISRSGTAELFW